MKIVITADLHYDSLKSRQPTVALAKEICRIGGDVLVLVGDTASAAHEPLRDCLGLFSEFAGRKLFVPGNHSLWCQSGEDSLQRYETIVPQLAAKGGFTMLDHDPTVLGSVGFVGSVGWYDYSYRNEYLEIPLEFYEAKVAPGAARRLPEHQELADRMADQVNPAHLEIATRWMDGVRMKMNMTDQQFLDYLLERLSRQLQAMDENPSVRQVLAFVHHLPFRELVPQDRPPPLAFAAAYLGSDRIGHTLLKCRKLSHVYCGHSHWPGRLNVNGVEVINVGSTYFKKRLEVLEVQD